jgi:uncharacterized protein (TIGR02757 family)
LASLQKYLDDLFEKYHHPRHLGSDPLEFVHRYNEPWDQEAIALVSAVLAYGNVKQIRNSITGVIELLGSLAKSPSAFVRSLDDASRVSDARRAFSKFVHRFNTGPDVVLLFLLLSRSWREYGSLGSHFLNHHSPDHLNFEIGLNGLMSDWRRWKKEFRFSSGKSFEYLLTAPSDGSCCKRWCMFLRWMGRKDSLDPGLWTLGSPLLAQAAPGRSLRSDQLVLPLDTHVARVSRYLGLSQRKSVNWKMAVEATQSLREYDPKDPTRYDFALARLGIVDGGTACLNSNGKKSWSGASGSTR